MVGGGGFLSRITVRSTLDSPIVSLSSRPAKVGIGMAMSRNEASKAEVCLILGNQYSPLGSHLAGRKDQSLVSLTAEFRTRLLGSSKTYTKGGC